MKKYEHFGVRWKSYTKPKYFLLLFVLVAVADSCERVQSRCPFDVENE